MELYGNHFTYRSRGFIAAILCGFCAIAPLKGQFFVSYSGGIGEYSFSGDPINTSVVSSGGGAGMAVSGGYIYVVDGGSGDGVSKFTTSGVLVDDSFITGLNNPVGIAVSGGDVFVTNYNSGTIGEYTTSGDVVNTALISGLAGPSAIAISGTLLFVTNGVNGIIGEYSTSGSRINGDLFSVGRANPLSIAVSGTNLFVGSNYSTGAIGEYTTSGATVNAVLINTGSIIPFTLATNGSDLFLVGNLNDSVAEYTTSGVLVDENFISDVESPGSIAIEGIPEPSWSGITVIGLGLVMFIVRRFRIAFTTESRRFVRGTCW